MKDNKEKIDEFDNSAPYTNEEEDGFYIDLKRPDEIKAYLDQYIIGQDEAKKVLSVAVYNHYKRIIYNANNPDKEKTDIKKSNVLILGDSGSGKTYMMQLIAKYLSIGTSITSCVSMTSSGYVGDDCESCITGALRANDYNLQKTQMSIVILDEFDKLRKAEAGPSITRDVGGEGVQQGLLKIVEGDYIGVPPNGGRKHPEQKLIYVDTTNILFVATGAFVGIEDIVKKRMGRNRIGFGVCSNKDENEIDYLANVTQQDLKAYGFIPEIIGRFPVIANTNPLDKDALKKILVEPKDSLVKQYVELLSMDGINLKFDDEALDEIAGLAFELETGARGLRSIIEEVMTDVMFNAPLLYENGTTEFTVTKGIVVENTKKFKKLQTAA